MGGATKEVEQVKTTKHIEESVNASPSEYPVQPSRTMNSEVSFEPWMVVQRPHRERWSGSLNGKGSEGRHDQRNHITRVRGSHFNALEVEEREIIGESTRANHMKILPTALNNNDATTGGGVEVTQVGQKTTSTVGPSKGAILVESTATSVQNRVSVGVGSCKAQGVGQYSEMDRLISAKEKLGLNQANVSSTLGPEAKLSHNDQSNSSRSLAQSMQTQCTAQSRDDAVITHMMEEDKPPDPGTEKLPAFMVRENPLSIELSAREVVVPDMSMLEVPRQC